MVVDLKIRLKQKNIDGFKENEEDLLGVGASGKVYKYSPNVDEKYVIKMMSSYEWESYDSFYEDFVWQTLIHEELNKLEDSIKVQGFNTYKSKDGKEYTCLIMDYFEGYKDCFSFLDSPNNWSRELKTPYKRKDRYKNDTFYTLTREIKLSIAKNLIKSVKQIHNTGIIHGDIKTNNFIIDPSNCNTKLIDFGAAIFNEDNRKYMVTDWKHGTLGYRAPEEDQNNLLGKKSDIYSLGVSIIELWTGDIWYSGESFKQCRNEVLKSLRVIEKDDPIIGNILRKCVDMNGNKRPTIEKLEELFEN